MSLTTLEAALPLLITSGTFLALSPWIAPESPRVRRVWRAFTLLTLARYLWWRVSSSLPEPELSWTFGYQVACLSVEAVFWYLVVGIRRRDARQIDRSAEATERESWWRERPPLVDILIPTYNESKAILERTILGATHQDYPNYRVWILDDGRRDWLESWAVQQGVRYLRRTDQKHYKAGNLNAGLARIRELGPEADFVAVIDADFVLKPRFLRRALSLMYDERTALVQTPQVFFNPDPFQHALGGPASVPDEQRYFFDYRLPIMDYVGYANCCGTSFVVRRTALALIGGFPTESVSEDTLMSMKLRRQGLRSVYLNEPLSSGLNPDGLKQYLSQRARWSLGLIQIMQSSVGPLAKKRGLAEYVEFFQECCTWAFFCAYHWFGAVIAIVFWLTGTYVIKAELTDILYYGGPLWVEGYVICWLTRGRYMPAASEAMEAITGFAVIPATLQALRSGGERAFVVTAKGVQRDKVVYHWKMLSCALVVAGLQLFGVVQAFVVPGSEIRNNELFGFMLFYSAQTLVTFLLIALVCIELPNRRHDQRFRADEQASLQTPRGFVEVRVRDIGVEGVALELPVGISVGDARTSVSLSAVGRVRARVANSKGQVLRLALEPTDEQRARLIRKLYCSDDYVNLPQAFSAWRFLSSLGQRLVS